MNESRSAEQEWEKFTADLADCLADLVEDEYLVISAKRKNYYVQFAAEGKWGMRAEAVSNAYLTENAQLSTDDRIIMDQLGWQPPTKLPGGRPDADGSPNFFQGFSSPVDFGSVSDLAVRTLRLAYGILHPGSLQYKAFDIKGAQIRFPTLRLKREN